MTGRPQSLREVAERAEDISHFGHEFADWLHTLRGGRSRPVPAWATLPGRVSPEPCFSTDSPESRARALRESPLPFKSRNLFTEKVGLPLRLRSGRPPKSADEKRRNNAGRQRRFRARRAVELQLLREIVDRD